MTQPFRYPDGRVPLAARVPRPEPPPPDPGRYVIAVAWRPGQTDRERAWEYVQGWYAPLGWPIIAADSGDEPFSRAKSRNLAASMAGDDWDAVLVLDADCLVDLDTVRAGMRKARETGYLILPHNGYTPLNIGQTRDVVTGAWFPPPNRLYLPRLAPGGLVCIPRPLWDALGGYDERYVGWGGEDSDLLTRAMRLTERRVDKDRLPGRIWHLWHPQSAQGET